MINKFNPKDHMIQLQGKDYLPVAARILWFRTDNPEGGIQTEVVQFDSEVALVKANVIVNGMIVATGYASCAAKTAKMGRYVEKAETSAIGRALGIAGYGTQFSGDDLDEGDHLSDSPQDRPAAPIESAATKAKRPYNPDTLQSMIEAGCAARNDSTVVSEDTSRKLAIKWGNILKGIADKPEHRHQAASFLLSGHIESFNQLSQGEHDTIDAWLTKDAPMAREEAGLLMDTLTNTPEGGPQ